MRNLYFTLSPSKGVKTYHLQVDGTKIDLHKRKGKIAVGTGEIHLLQYYFKGNSGSTLKITGKDSEDEIVVEVKEAKIPTGQIRHGNHEKFKF